MVNQFLPSAFHLFLSIKMLLSPQQEQWEAPYRWEMGGQYQEEKYPWKFPPWQLSSLCFKNSEVLLLLEIWNYTKKNFRAIETLKTSRAFRDAWGAPTALLNIYSSVQQTCMPLSLRWWVQSLTTIQTISRLLSCSFYIAHTILGP